MKQSILATFLMAMSMSAESYHSSYKEVDVDLKKFPKADLSDRSSGRFRDAKKAEFGAIRDAQSTILTPTRSIDSLFLRLPSSNELDELILGADSVAILKTIQTVATDDSIPCDQRIAYLLEVLGRIRCAIAKKEFAALTILLSERIKFFIHLS